MSELLGLEQLQALLARAQLHNSVRGTPLSYMERAKCSKSCRTDVQPRAPSSHACRPPRFAEEELAEGLRSGLLIRRNLFGPAGGPLTMQSALVGLCVVLPELSVDARGTTQFA